MSDLAEQLRRWSDNGALIAAEEVRARARRRRGRQVLAGAMAGVAAIAAGAIALVQLDSPSVERVTAGASSETRTPPTARTGLVGSSVGVAGTLDDGRPFSVRRHPQRGLCVTLGDIDIGCDDVGPVTSGDPQATPRWAFVSVDGDLSENNAAELCYGSLPVGATGAMVVHDDGRRSQAGLVIDGTSSIWAMPVTPGDNPDHVVFLDAQGRELLRFPRFPQ